MVRIYQAFEIRYERSKFQAKIDEKAEFAICK